MARRSSILDAVVVGAGVVGATAALALARDGRRVALVEARQPEPWQASRHDPRVFALAQDSVALLDGLGLWSAIRVSRAQSYRRMQVWDAAGGGELVFDGDRLGHPTLGWIVEQGVLIEHLWRALAVEAGVERYCPERVAGFVSEADAISVDLAAAGRLRARVLVAADGAGSALREMAGISVDRHDYRQRALVAYVATRRPHGETAWQRFLPDGPLAFLPFSDGVFAQAAPGCTSSIVWTQSEAEAERRLAVPDAVFRSELERAFDATLGEIVAATPPLAFPLHRQLAAEYVAGRMVLVGDAAHAVHPLAGQGVNLGLRDVACLRRMIAAAGERDIGAPWRLARYQRERRSDATVSAHAFETIDRLFSNDAVLPTLVRGHLLGLAGHMPLLPRLLWRHAAGL
ncbi:MAG TPA: 2-octaprenyl-3-methyl-6-methoxy-1,4-benzoquinol hydroxylase [Xanthomonadales bacterium]|nr:2-octaprenyl-3-methyl-6-methoxy-1,4-benzoquinol hydroxylase [Xanthomonadales bacterium]